MKKIIFLSSVVTCVLLSSQASALSTFPDGTAGVGGAEPFAVRVVETQERDTSGTEQANTKGRGKSKNKTRGRKK